MAADQMVPSIHESGWRPRSGPRWSREEVAAFLRHERLDYQRIRLPYGFETRGEDRTATADEILPPDLTGRTVLDVGSNLGFFCFEAARRGARRVLGIDVDPENVRKARLLADCLGIDVEFRLLDVERDRLEEQFDYVLAINLLHHLRNPLSAIETLVGLTRTRLALEVAGLGRHEQRKLGLASWRARVIGASPIVFVGRGSTSPAPPGAKQASMAGGQRFFFSPRSLVHLLRYQRCSFARVDVQRSPHKGRYIVKADKRRIGHLIVVAGPTACGKSTLIERLKQGLEPGIAEDLGLSKPESAICYDAFDLIEPRPANVDTVLFHYDILRPFGRSAHVHARDEALEVLRSADRVTILTIYLPPDELARRFDRAVIRRKRRFGILRGGTRKRAVGDVVRDTVILNDWYRRWFDHCREKSVDSRVLLAGEGAKIVDVESWRRTALGASA